MGLFGNLRRYICNYDYQNGKEMEGEGWRVRVGPVLKEVCW